MQNPPQETDTQILHRDDLALGGFAGLREHRLVTDRRVFGGHKHPDAWDGLGAFVYLADAHFVPHGETGLHPHQKIDVISVMVEGRIAHEGSLHAGEEIAAPAVQVQRSGDAGFNHNEVNPDDTPNRMIQIWMLPDQPSQNADYQTHLPAPGAVTRVYGGAPSANDPAPPFPSQTVIDVAMLDAQQAAEFNGPFVAYVTRGSGLANGLEVNDGDLIRGEGLSFTATQTAQLIVVGLSW